MDVERNVIITVVIQCCAAVSVVYNILVPQFFFYGVLRYESTFIEDIKSMIRKFDQRTEDGGLKRRIVEMIQIHNATLKYKALF